MSFVGILLLQHISFSMGSVEQPTPTTNGSSKRKYVPKILLCMHVCRYVCMYVGILSCKQYCLFRGTFSAGAPQGKDMA